RRPDSDVYRRWEVAGAAHSGYQGQAYRAPLSERDLPDGAPQYDCLREPFSRIPLHHVVVAGHVHLARWIDGKAPPRAPYLRFDGASKVRNEMGLAQGGIQLPQMRVPTAINTGDNAGQTFCFLFGSHQPLEEAQLRSMYRSHNRYVTLVSAAVALNVSRGYLLPGDGLVEVIDAARSDVAKPPRRVSRRSSGQGRDAHPRSRPERVQAADAREKLPLSSDFPLDSVHSGPIAAVLRPRWQRKPL